MRTHKARQNVFYSIVNNHLRNFLSNEQESKRLVYFPKSSFRCSRESLLNFHLFTSHGKSTLQAMTGRKFRIEIGETCQTHSLWHFLFYAISDNNHTNHHFSHLVIFLHNAENYSYLTLTNSVRSRIDVDGEEHIFHGSSFIGHGTSWTCCRVVWQ